MPKVSSWRLHARGRTRLVDEAGFSLVEAIVSLTLASMLILSLTYTLGSGLKGVQDTRLFQQATALGTQTVEQARDTSYDALVMRTADLDVGDTAIGTSGGYRVYDPDGGGGLSAERVVHQATTVTGGVDPHVTTETVGGATFSIRRYVTWVDEDSQGGTSQDYKRLSTLVTWNSPTGPHRYRTSTFLTEALRGLPTPKFTVTPTTQTEITTPGVAASFPHTIVNNGIADAYDFRVSSTPSGWTLTFYRDVDQDGVYTSGGDGTTALSDTNGDGAPDTGSVAPGASFPLVIYVQIPTSQPVGSTDLDLVIRSGLDSTVRNAITTDTLIVTYAPTTLYLHNNPTPPTADTTAQSSLTMNSTAPTATTLRAYSTNYYNVAGRPGRHLATSTSGISESGSSTQTDAARSAWWNYSIPSARTYSGTPSYRIFVANADFDCSRTMNVRVQLRQKTTAGSNTTVSGRLRTANRTATPVGSGGVCPFLLLSGDWPAISGWNANTTQAFEVKVSTLSATGGAVLHAFDTTAYDSSVTLP